MKVFLKNQLLAWDKYTIDNESITELDLIKQAGRSLFASIDPFLVNKGRVFIFCGSGNNGSDGLALAMNLLTHHHNPFVLFIGESKTGSCNHQLLTEYISKGGALNYIKDLLDLPEIQQEDVIIEAIFGIGLNKPITGFLAKVIGWINISAAEVWAIDVPSGMEVDKFTQSNPTTCITATRTFTIQSMKLAFLTGGNRTYTGEVQLCDIGLSLDFLNKSDTIYHWVDRDEASTGYVPRSFSAEKRDFGSVLLIGGDKNMQGALLLAIKAALRSGAGLTYACPVHESQLPINCVVPEVMIFDADRLVGGVRPNEMNRFKSIAIGPGLGRSDKAAELLRACLQLKRPLIIDADAIVHIAMIGIESVPKGSLFTPHQREFDHLFGACENEDEYVAKQLELAVKHQLFILRKGPFSKLATPTGKLIVNSTGNPGLAKGGSGDVLTGTIAGLYSRQGDMEFAATAGMYLHGLAADLSIKTSFIDCLIATDVIDHLPLAFKETFN